MKVDEILSGFWGGQTQPFEKMVGFFGKSAHIGGADIEKVSEIYRAIGEPTAELRCLLD